MLSLMDCFLTLLNTCIRTTQYCINWDRWWWGIWPVMPTAQKCNDQLIVSIAKTEQNVAGWKSCKPSAPPLNNTNVSQGMRRVYKCVICLVFVVIENLYRCYVLILQYVTTSHNSCTPYVRTLLSIPELPSAYNHNLWCFWCVSFFAACVISNLNISDSRRGGWRPEQSFWCSEISANP